MTFEEILDQAIAMLQRRGRVSYRALKLQFHLDDDSLETLKEELLYSQPQVVDEEGRGVVWIGEADPSPASASLSAPSSSAPESAPLSYTPKHLVEKILLSRTALEGERKQVTVLFCDITNSTMLAAHLGPEGMHRLLNRFFALALTEIHRYEGTMNQFLGDGFMALFGAPIAHEDHARRAILAAVGIQRALTEGNIMVAVEQERERSSTQRFQHEKMVPASLHVRMGLNTGLVVVGSIGDNLRMDYTAVGDTTHLAARLQQHAEPGTILLSDPTFQCIKDVVRVESLGPLSVKGKTDPITVHKLLGLKPRRSPSAQFEERMLSRFVGREQELALLHELLHQVEQGQGQVVSIVGEAGAGKSRLLYEFRQRLTGTQLTSLEGHCLSYGRALPYLPLIDILRNQCGISETDSPERITEKVGVGLQDVGMDPEAWAPYLLRLLGVKEGTARLAKLSPEGIKTRTFDTLRQMSLHGSQRRPILLAVEDLHWIDKTSEEYLTLLVESVVGAPLLLLGTYRPGYRPPWLDKSYATQLALHPLAPQDSVLVIHSLVPHQGLPESLAQVILAKADGNPFFLEELTRTLLEHQDLRATVTVPDTIQGVLMARIDRLPDPAKHLLQTASVLGRSFSLPLLEALWDQTGHLASLLQTLKRLEFLSEQSGTAKPLYVFKHALTQEVAYESLLLSRRCALHTAAGQTLETLYANRLEEVYDRLVYHYARTDQADKAVEYLTRVAKKAARGYAHAEVVVAMEEALGHAERLPVAQRDPCVLDLLTRQAWSLHYLGRFQEIVELLLGYQERLEHLHDPVRAGWYYYRLSMAYSFLGQRESVAQTLPYALHHAEQAGDVIALGMVHDAWAVECLFSGHYLSGITHGQQAVSLLKNIDEQYWLGEAYYTLGLLYIFSGNCRLALETTAKLAAIGETMADRRLQTNAATTAGWAYTTQGEWEAGITACQQALDYTPDRFETAFIVGILGYAYLEKDDHAKAISLLEQAVQQANQYRSRQVRGWFMAWLGEAYRLDGQLERAHDVACRGLEMSTDITYKYGIGWAQHVLGRVALMRGTLPEAERHLQEAFETFGSIQARCEIGRVHVSLATLAHDQGNQENARTHLQEAYSVFKTLQVPRYMERAVHYAREWGIFLPVEQSTLRKDDDV